jgi:ADP-ribose pyrophosphatase YjhB (NUDIX family)
VAFCYDKAMITCTFEDGNQSSLRHLVVDTIVTKDNRILLVKRTGKLLEGGKWGLVGGFVDRDETTAQTAAREVMEETGWQVKGLTLLRINDSPNRPKEDRQNVALIYFCTATKKTGEPDWESDEQKWFSWDELPDNDKIAFDHAETISLYRKYLKDQPALPLIG